MKQKLFIFAGLALLLVIVFFITKDLFFDKPESKDNPYEYNLDKLRNTDSLETAYKEILQFPSALEEIHAIATDDQDRIYVGGTNGLELFDNKGKLFRKVPLTGTVSAISVNQKNEIFICIGNHLEILDLSGKQIAKWESPGAQSILTSVAVTFTDVFLADAGEKIVYHYDLKGRLINRIGEKDPQNEVPGFVVPSPYFDLAVSKNGELWIVNPGRHSVENFTYAGDLTSSWGEPSMALEGFCGCCNPSHFALFQDGSFVTSEKGIERIKLYSPDGKFKCIVALPESFEEGTRGLDLAVDSQSRILVLDPVKKSVRVFIKK
jgi:hypothetical protein